MNFGNTPEFIIDAWEHVDEKGEVIFYRMVLAEDEKIHLRWKIGKDEDND